MVQKDADDHFGKLKANKAVLEDVVGHFVDCGFKHLICLLEVDWTFVAWLPDDIPK